MTTSVCHTIQTKFDPWLIGLKLASPTHNFALSSTQNLHPQQQNTTKKMSSRNGDLGGWSFLQALTMTIQNSQNEKDEKVYVHPLVKKSTSKLTEKSLEMCTESLGSETGSTINESIISSPLFSSTTFEKSQRMPCFHARERMTSGFPPPLTTIRGGSSGGVQVKSQRQDGRLVLKAVSVETQQSCFEAERRDGRLRLCIKEDNIIHDHYKQDFVQQDDEVFDDDDDDDDDDDVNDNDHDYDEDYVVNNMEGRGGNNNIGGEVEFSGTCCKEGRKCKEMLNWEPYWIATS